MSVLLLNQPWIESEAEYGLRAGVRWAQIRKRDRSMPFYSFPYALASATSYLKAHGIEAVLRDSIALGERKDQALQHIADHAYDIVVLETSTASIACDLDFCDAIKTFRPATTVCLAGQHATAMPDHVLRSSRADFVLIGEYEKTLLDLCRCLDGGQPPAARMKGLAYLREGQIIDGGRHEPLDLRELPPPYRDPATVQTYNEPSARFFPNAAVMTSRGCSFQCTFCVEASVNYGAPSRFRYRPLDNVRQEILALATDHGVREIFFDDSFFTEKRAIEISALMEALPVRLHWSCWIDRGISKETLRRMKKAGCSGVKFGVETFDPEIGLAARKRVRRETVEALVRRCRRAGLLTHASYVFGLPGETRQTLERTLQAAAALRTTSFQASIAIPIPGTELFDQARRNGWLRTTNWSEYEGQGSSVLRYEDLNEADLLWAMTRARRLKIRRLLQNPVALSLYAIKLLRMMGPREFLRDMQRKAAFLLAREAQPRR
ncbi:B12-binding domain-containing radical SAM protein [Inquilinus sp. NPDC058860]|uniref:B12-binding domain-containing radical SAM protein n=1 Tax=Inquilinus sp. NPDC058860 TaxID=3346652 RepID=UPI00368986C8